MTIRSAGQVRFGMIFATVLLAISSWTAARAQPFTASSAIPPIPPSGAWGEVIMATPKWLVIQNHQGQQFPIAMDAINQFLIRWPASLDQLSPATIVEAIGQDLGSNQVMTEHVDVFEGSDQTLVAPTYQSMIANNRLVTTIDPTFQRTMNAWDIDAQVTLYGWAYPVPPGATAIPARLHVVGNVLMTDPLRLGVPGNNIATVVPPPSGNLAVTQVTRGSSSFAQKGDVAFLMPTSVSPKSLTLGQLVLYKRIPLRQYAAP